MILTWELRYSLKKKGPTEYEDIDFEMGWGICYTLELEVEKNSYRPCLLFLFFSGDKKNRF